MSPQEEGGLPPVWESYFLGFFLKQRETGRGEGGSTPITLSLVVAGKFGWLAGGNIYSSLKATNDPHPFSSAKSPYGGKGLRPCCLSLYQQRMMPWML